MSIHMMVDIESFAGSSRMGGSAICQIGAVKWNINNGEIKSEFLINTIPDMRDTPANYETLRWWFNQKREAQQSLFTPEPISLRAGLEAFAGWYGNGAHADGTWSHATFDVPALQQNFQMLGLKVPWPYRSAKDIRTLNWLCIQLGGQEFMKQNFVKATLDHNALADAIEQAKNVTVAYNYIKDKLTVREDDSSVEQTENRN